jgi:uncharacterized integral membrane protein
MAMESPNVPLDLSDFALADAQFLPTLEEMNEAAGASKPIVVRAKKSRRAWGRVILGITAIVIVWLLIISNTLGFEKTYGTISEPEYALYVVLSVLWGIIWTITLSYVLIYSGLRRYSMILSADDEGITFWIYKNKKKRLRWQDIRWWQILDFSDESLPSNSYYMYLFHRNDDPPGSGWNQPASIRYRWEEPTGAHLRNVGITGDRHITFQQQIRLARALIALHLGPPRGEPLESFASNEVHDASHRA